MGEQPPYPYISDISDDLIAIHNEVKTFSVFINNASQRKYADNHLPLSRATFQKLHGESIALHKAIFDICSIGWAHIAGITLRSLYDILITLYLVGETDHEYRAFKYFYWEFIKDGDFKDKDEFDKGYLLLSDTDKTRITQYIKEGKKRNYWFNPEYNSPSDAINRTVGNDKNDVGIYHVLSGISHGGHIGIGFFRDEHDELQLQPKSNPKSAKLVVASSISKILGICRLRIQFEMPELSQIYEEIYAKFLKAKDSL